MNSLFSELFKDFFGGILGVCETIWGLFGGRFEGFFKAFRGKTIHNNAKNYKSLIFYYLNIALNSLVNE